MIIISYSIRGLLLVIVSVGFYCYCFRNGEVRRHSVIKEALECTPKKQTDGAEGLPNPKEGEPKPEVNPRSALAHLFSPSYQLDPEA